MSRSMRDERGAIMAISAILIPVLLVITALIYDGGTWFTHKRQLQNRADAGALAAGYQLGLDWPACGGDALTKLAAENRIDAAARRYAGDPQEAGTLHNNLLCGEGGMISAEPAARVRALAEIAAADPRLADALCDGAPEQMESELERMPQFHTSYREYLEKFGDRCLEELKLESPTLFDQPETLLRSVGQLARRLASGERAGAASVENEIRAEAERRVRAALRFRPRSWSVLPVRLPSPSGVPFFLRFGFFSRSQGGIDSREEFCGIAVLSRVARIESGWVCVRLCGRGGHGRTRREGLRSLTGMRRLAGWGRIKVRNGDADLSGVTDIGDFALLGANFNNAGKWVSGDFNYDNITDISDFALLAANFNLAAAGNLPRGAAVPEPSAALAVVGLAVSLIGRRRCVR